MKIKEIFKHEIYYTKKSTYQHGVYRGLTFLGYISYNRLPVELIPNAELPMLFVTGEFKA